MCVAGFAGRQRQVGSAGIRQGAGSGGQRGQRQGHSLMVIEVMSLSITNGGSISDRARCLSLPPSTSSSTAHLQDVLDLAELLPQHLLLVEAEGRVVRGHGEQ